MACSVPVGSLVLFLSDGPPTQWAEKGHSGLRRPLQLLAVHFKLEQRISLCFLPDVLLEGLQSVGYLGGDIARKYC